MSLLALTWSFTGGVVLHNLEESLFLPKWTRHAKYWPRPVGTVEFIFGAAVLSGLVVFVTALATISSPGSCAEYLVAGMAFAMMLNAIVPHAVLTLYERAYMPGTASALLLNLPLGFFLLRGAFMTNQIKVTTFYWSGPCVVFAMLALMPLLLHLGSRVANKRMQDC